MFVYIILLGMALLGTSLRLPPSALLYDEIYVCLHHSFRDSPIGNESPPSTVCSII